MAEESMQNKYDMGSADGAGLPQQLAERLIAQLETVVFGQRQVIELLLIGLFAEGHLLIEGLPGTAKTTLVKTLSQLLQLDFKRIQLTPDMLPSEIIGTSVYDLNNKSFSFKPGPVFTDLLLADEINRTPPKTQSALLEAMEEQQVTTDGQRHALSSLFTVIATLNPIEFEGTYPLPEAQLDRFMMKINVTYPEKLAEKQMLSRFSEQPGLRSGHQAQLSPAATREDILACRRAMSSVHVDDAVMDYMLEIVRDTRVNPGIELGCSPRAALALMAAARGYAAIRGQGYVTPDHVKAVAAPVLRHRILLSAEAELDGLTHDHVLKQTLAKIPVPR